jgi:hypothetical protein
MARNSRGHYGIKISLNFGFRGFGAHAQILVTLVVESMPGLEVEPEAVGCGARQDPAEPKSTPTVRRRRPRTPIQQTE